MKPHIALLSILTLCVVVRATDHEEVSGPQYNAPNQKAATPDEKPIARPVAPPAEAPTSAPAEEKPKSPVSCETKGNRTILVNAKGKQLGGSMSADECDQSVKAAHNGVVCGITGPDPKLRETTGGSGWRPVNIETGVGLGHFPIPGLSDCLKVTKASAGGIVCGYTGFGWKVTNINTNQRCGSSGNTKGCLMSTSNSRNYWTCSYTGTGPNGWEVTQIGKSCGYQGGHSSIESCVSRIPKSK